MSLGCASPSSCLRPPIPPGAHCRSALPGLLRDAMWALAPWHSQALAAWIEEIQPDVLLFAPGESVFPTGSPSSLPKTTDFRWWPFVTTASTPLRAAPSPAPPLPPAPSLGPAASGRRHLPAHCQPAHVRGLRPLFFHPLPGALHTPSAPHPRSIPRLRASGTLAIWGWDAGGAWLPSGGLCALWRFPGSPWWRSTPKRKTPYFVPFHQGKRPPVLRQRSPAPT